uniref:Secreted protein n=1 Tax=Arundo donax TaxID=35708 RepID=A0A0A9FC90_ARUDO
MIGCLLRGLVSWLHCSTVSRPCRYQRFTEYQRFPSCTPKGRIANRTWRQQLFGTARPPATNSQLLRHTNLNSVQQICKVLYRLYCSSCEAAVYFQCKLTENKEHKLIFARILTGSSNARVKSVAGILTLPSWMFESFCCSTQSLQA